MATSGTFYRKDHWGAALVPCAPYVVQVMLLNFKFSVLRNPVKTY